MKTRKTRDALLAKGLDLLWPPSCPICGAPSVNSKLLCFECWSELNILSEPKCDFCGCEVKGLGAPICIDCYDNSRAWDYGSSCAHYEGIARKMILRLKNMQAENLAPIIAKIAIDECGEVFERTDLLVPIPLHWFKQLRRGYNQAALIAYHLSRQTGIAMAENILIRKRYTKPQTKFNRFDDRYANLEEAFGAKNVGKIEGKNILLIDDVMTSGASFEIGARILSPYRAASIGVFAFARAGQSGHS